ncbi:hypothetical protein AHAS_Ahas05G0213500 [Arachis hypogaea]
MKHFQIGLKSTLIATDLAFNVTLLQAFNHCTQLTQLSLFKNSLSNPVPPESIGNFNKRVMLDLSHNHLRGSIPSDVIHCTLQTQVDVSQPFLQQLCWNVNPKRIAKCRNLFNLDFSGNKISGLIPVEGFSHMDLLENLNFSRNHIDGQIPESLGTT